jgi:uncharacterized protein YdeI (YjbR/CyaY-like superfamily)
MTDHTDAVYFDAPSDLRHWLEANHETTAELWVGFHRRATGRPTIAWAQLVDEVLCFGWIDGLRKGIDADRWAIRITPRKRTSIWSAVNVRRVPELVAAGRMTPAGLRVFEARDTKKVPYSYETGSIPLDAASEARLRANDAAWRWFQAQPPSYRRTAGHWVMSPKREDTHQRRLATLIEDSASGRKVKPLSYGERS